MTEAQRAHLRCLEQSQLVVRTHFRREEAPQKRKTVGAARPIRVGRRTFRSFREAVRKSKHGPNTIWRWLQTDPSKARYL